MTDYTPTTEEVREAWGEYKCSQPCKECPVEFNRWLAEVKADAWQEGYTAGKPYPQLISKNPYWQGENK